MYIQSCTFKAYHKNVIVIAALKGGALLQLPHWHGQTVPRGKVHPNDVGSRGNAPGGDPGWGKAQRSSVISLISWLLLWPKRRPHWAHKQDKNWLILELLPSCSVSLFSFPLPSPCPDSQCIPPALFIVSSFYSFLSSLPSLPPPFF